MSLTTGGLTLPRRGSLVAGGLTLADLVGGSPVTVGGATAVLTWQAYAGTASGGSLAAPGATASMSFAANVGSLTLSTSGPNLTLVTQLDLSRKRASFYS